MAQYLFTYGTLRMNADHPMAGKLAENAKLVGLGYMRNTRLYRVDWYPALVHSSHVDDVVIGDVLALEHPDFLKELDEYENIGVGQPPFEYRRELVEVILEHSGKKINCWVYFYNWSLPQNAEWLESGDFLNP
ncbi:MAG: gamma-glutamylcyclotransferase [Chitinophagales bacterium]|nr:gamma-glutamylcyclotransferase [Chitinophagales bacterium]